METRKRKYILGIVLIIFFMIGTNILIKYSNRIELIQLSPNSHSQMMGYIIKTKNNKVIAIDGGTASDTENFLNNIDDLGGKIDYWFITHPHKDHASVFIEVAENHPEVEIGNIYYTLNDLAWYEENEPSRAYEVENFYNVLNNESIKNKSREVYLNQIIQMDNISCEILGIKNPEITTGAINNSSMVIKFKVNDKSILFLGDTQVESETKLLNVQGEKKLKADIVQMAHHGQSRCK